VADCVGEVMLNGVRLIEWNTVREGNKWIIYFLLII
jgi:hypothetical protein